ncbi:hypothetical protein E2C01_057581 [Portunus trituberculatus]|uniref:Uncharacterized protein n=1 Tax=Portunus trituberculatus TaxID=210409 RepID=A0A5B7GXC5_PORTR|nr:hypothetical protein [Portunus trituberculatus]
MHRATPAVMLPEALLPDRPLARSRRGGDDIAATRACLPPNIKTKHVVQVLPEPWTLERLMKTSEETRVSYINVAA